MAVFFLGGLYLRGHLPFVGLLALAVGIDWAAIELAGVSDFCVTPAYAFLLPAYAVLWYGGRAWAPRMRQDWRGVSGALLVALVCASLSFAISNGAFTHTVPPRSLVTYWIPAPAASGYDPAAGQPGAGN